MSDELVASLLPHTSWLELSAGDHLWRTGDPCTHFVFISRGLVEVVRESAHGEESVLGIFGPSEGVGNVATMERGRYPASALAASKRVVVAKIAAPALRDALERDPTLALAAQHALIENARKLRVKVEVLTAGPIHCRLSLLLLHLAENYGDEDVDGSLRIPIHLSRSCLARLVGSREETVIRIMSRWRKRGWIETLAKGFVIRAPSDLASVQQTDDDKEESNGAQ